MKRDEKASRKSLDDAILEIRQDRLDADQVLEASERVWEKIGIHQTGESMKGCADVQGLIPDYLEDRLSEAKTLLLTDHIRECVTCRKVLTAARSKTTVRPSFEPRPDKTSFWMKWGSIAAGLLLLFGLFQMGALERFMPWEGAVVAVLQEADGKVLQVYGENVTSIDSNENIRSRQVVRTASDAGAILRLADGSQIEMAERTELAVLDGWFSNTIQLRRGNVIVDAVPQGSGQLYVSTDECRVAVKGTVFSVSHGIKGSRVSVIEGEVLVEKGALNRTLKSGEQFASQPSLSQVSVQEDIAWSQSADDHLALLEEFSTLHKDLHQATFGDELRYSSRLLDLLPRGTVVYGAIPNVSGQLRDVYQLFLERLDESGALREWYQERFPADEGVVLGNIVEKLAGFGDYLGEEVVFAVVQLPEGSFAPVTLAEVTDESHLWAMANEEANRINDLAEKGPVVFVIEDPDARGSSKGLFVLIEAGLVVVSPSLQVLELVGGDSLNEFSESRFYQSILGSYSEGVDWLLSVDLQGLRGDSTPEELEKLGLSQLYDLVVQRKLGQEGIAENQAVLTYEGGEEGGIISWIADPGPIGGMEYVSPEAYVAAAFVVNDPAEMVESLMVYLEQYDTSAFSALEQFEAEHNISFLDDIAAPLGGEIVFCIDGPILPEPSWKVIVEVYDPQTLQGTIEYVVEEINRLVTHNGGSGIELLADSSGEMTVYSVRKMDSDSSFDYAFTNGYMIIATDRSLIYSARQFQDARYTLVDSPDFVRSLPRNESLNLSAVFYQNLAPMVSAILSSPIGESVGGLSPEVRVSLEDLLGDAEPLLVTLNAEPGQLTLASGGDLESFWMNLGALASVGGPEGITDLLWGRVQGQ